MNFLKRAINAVTSRRWIITTLSIWSLLSILWWNPDLAMWAVHNLSIDENNKYKISVSHKSFKKNTITNIQDTLKYNYTAIEFATAEANMATQKDIILFLTNNRVFLEWEDFLLWGDNPYVSLKLLQFRFDNICSVALEEHNKRREEQWLEPFTDIPYWMKNDIAFAFAAIIHYMNVSYKIQWKSINFDQIGSFRPKLVIDIATWRTILRPYLTHQEIQQKK